jgi:hypothetical protein
VVIFILLAAHNNSRCHLLSLVTVEFNYDRCHGITYFKLSNCEFSHRSRESRATPRLSMLMSSGELRTGGTGSLPFFLFPPFTRHGKTKPCCTASAEGGPAQQCMMPRVCMATQ